MVEHVAQPADTAPPLWVPLSVKSYRFLFVGQTLSLLGDQFLVVALPFILMRYGGAIALGQVLAAYGAARVLALPLGGWLGDRFSRRAVMLVSDLFRGLLVLALFLLASRESAGVTQVAIIMAVVGLAEGIFLPASFAILPFTVPPELLSRANALSGGAQNLVMLAGPGLGGLLASTLSPSMCLAVDAATFAISAVTLILVRESAPAEESPGAAAGERPMTFGRFLLENRLIQVATLITVMSNLAYFGMLEVALPVLSADVHLTGELGFGLSLAGYGFGSLIGSFFVVSLERRKRRGVVAVGLGLAQGVLFSLVAVGAGLPVTVLLMALAGLTNGVLNPFYLSRIQEGVPGPLMGRAMSVLMLAVFAVHPVSVAAAAALTRTQGPQVGFLAAGLSIVIAFAVGGMTRTYREL